MQGRFHWSNYYKRAQFLALSAYIAIVILLSILRPFNFRQHIFLLLFTSFLFYIQKIRGYIPYYFLKYLKLILIGNLRTNQKYIKPV